MKLYYTILLCAVLTTFEVQAQDNSENPDSTRTSYLDEVVISANKIPESKRFVSQQVHVIDPNVIKNFNAQNSADLLTNTGYVAMQKSQQGGGSPNLRGFEASRVLLMIDGVRMNNLIYRAGHLQNVITTDNNIMERAEVLFGPSSTVYGSDALGGVIHFYTRNPQLAKAGLSNPSGNAFFRYGSVNSEKTGHFDFNIGGEKFASLTSFTFSDFGDLRMGEKTNSALGEQFGVRNNYVVRAADNQSDILVTNSDPYVQKFSGYKQYDLLQKFLFKSSDRVSHLLNFQYSNSTDVPRYDRLTDPDGAGLRSAEWYYGPQKRVMTSYQLKVSDLGSFADAMTATVSYQDVEESRHNRRFNRVAKTSQIEKVKVWGLTVDFQKSMGKSDLRYGLDGQFNSLKSTAHITDVTTGAQTAASTRYPNGDNTMNFMALYLTHTLRINEKWTLNDGVRLGGSSLNAQFTDKTFFPFPYDDVKQNNFTGSANVGLIYTPTTWKVSFLASTGFRSPNVDDLAKVFESAPGLLVVPNPDLGPEKTVNGDFSVTKFFGSKLRLNGTFYATQFFDAIVTLPTTFNGQTTVDYDGTPSLVVSSQNKGKAYLYGYSAGFQADLTNQIAFTGSINYTHGRVKNDGANETPLDHIPPSFGRLELSFTADKFRSELFSNFNGWKPITSYSSSGEDNQAYAHPLGTAAWYTINVRASYEVNKMITVQAGVDNILDLQYRVFSSGINAPGRNIFGTLRFKF